MLNKEECLFERDETGQLLGKKVALEKLESKPEVIVRPLPRGRLMSIYNKANVGTIEEKEQADIDLIISGLVEPVFTEEEVKALKPQYALAITTAILSISLGKEQDEVNKTQETVLEEEISLKK